MTARTRWIVLGVVLLLVLGLVALYNLNSNLTQSTVEEGGYDGRTWVVQPGDTLTLTADQVGRGDEYRCSDEDLGVNLEVAADGSATVYCGGPPAGY